MYNGTHVFIKIKTMHKTLLYSLMFICFPLMGVAQAQPNSSVSTSVNFSLDNAQNLPQGYMSLISDYQQVQGQMVRDINAGRGAQWRQWVQPGVDRNESLYWWLLAEWYFRNNRQDLAYQSALQAVVLQRLELAQCGSRSTNETTVNNMLRYHAHIVQLRPSQETIRVAVLKAITRVEDLARRQQLSNGMSCYIPQVQSAQIRRNARPIVIVDYNNLEERQKRSQLRRQNIEIAKIKQDFSYEKIFGNSNMNDLWKAIPQ